MKDKTLTKPWHFLSTGASVDKFTPLGAMLMGASVFLYAFIQVRPGIHTFEQCVANTFRIVMRCSIQADQITNRGGDDAVQANSANDSIDHLQSPSSAVLEF